MQFFDAGLSSYLLARPSPRIVLLVISKCVFFDIHELMDIVLVHPDIPFNTGNVARTCISTNTTLHLIKPLGFSIEDKDVKRAGLDYWKDVKLVVHESWEAFLNSPTGQKPKYLFSRFAEKLYWDAKFTSDSVLIFGSETDGLPAGIKKQHENDLYRIPTPGPVRSLNLSTSAGIVLFEALRQCNGPASRRP